MPLDKIKVCEKGMNNVRKNQILESFNNKAYRDEFCLSNNTITLSLQIRLMRKKRGWSQSYLAKRLGKSRSTITRWENTDKGYHNIDILNQLASIFDVSILTKFISFYELADEIGNKTLTNLSLVPFNENK